MRILVVGPSASGKTELGQRLASNLGLPFHQLAIIEAGRPWSNQPTVQQLREQRAITSGADWVIDGTYLPTLPLRLSRADLVVLVDPHPIICLAGMLRRYGRPGHTSRMRQIGYILRFRRSVRPKVLAAVHEHAPGARLVRVTSRRQVAGLLAELGGEGGTCAPEVEPSRGGRPRAADPWGEQHPA